MSKNKNTELDQSERSGAQAGLRGNELGINRIENSGSWFRLAPQTTLVVLVCVAAVLGLLTAQFEEFTRVPFLLMAGFFLLMVWLRSAFALSCLFLVFGSFVFIKRIRISNWVDSNANVIFDSDLMFTLLVMTFAATCFRYLETKKYCLGILSKFGWGAGGVKGKHSSREFPSLLGGRWWLIPISIAVALVLLRTFPLDVHSVQKYWIRPAPARLIFLFGVLFLTWFVTRSFFSLVMRWKMDEDQAGVHVRSVFAKEFWREHRAIEVRRAKAISKKS